MKVQVDTTRDLAQFTHSAALNVQVPIACMSTEDQVRLLEWLAKELFLGDKLDALEHDRLSHYVVKCIGLE